MDNKPTKEERKDLAVELDFHYELNKQFGAAINKKVDEIVSYVHRCAGTIILAAGDKIIREHITTLLSEILKQANKSGK